MRLHWRQMKPHDVPGAVELLSSHPLERKRYGRALKQLPSVWQQLLRRNCLNAFVVEDLDRPRDGLCGLVATVFVTDAFVQECKNSKFWLGPELTQRVHRGASPILTPQSLRHANSNGGVNLVAWTSFVPGGESPDGLVNRALMDAFVQAHCGYQIKEICAQHLDAGSARIAMNGGLFRWERIARKYDTGWRRRGLPKLVQRPFLLGVSRELACENIGSWVSQLLYWTPPRIGFSPAEQRVLLCALRQGTDEDLSDDLGLSHSTVKNTWRSIFERASRRMPGLLPSAPGKENGAATKRGKEKRQRLFAYLREHPEELRPFRRMRAEPELNVAAAD